MKLIKKFTSLNSFHNHLVQNLQGRTFFKMGNEPSEAWRGDRVGYSNASFSFPMKCPDKQYSLLSFTDWNFRSPVIPRDREKGVRSEIRRQVVRKVKMSKIRKLIMRSLTKMESRYWMEGDPTSRHSLSLSYKSDW